MRDYTIDDFEHLVTATMMGQGTEAFDIKGSFSKLLGGVKEYFTGKLLGLDQPIATLNVKAASQIMAKYNYTDLMDQVIHQPSHLGQLYYPWVMLLNDAVGYCQRLQSEDVPQVLKWIGDCLNEQASVVYVPKNSGTDKLMIDIEKRLSQALCGRDDTSTVFGQKYDTMGNFNTSYLEQARLVESITRRGPKEFRIQIDRLAILADELHQRITDGEVKFTAAQLKVFSNIILRLARAADLYSVIMTLIITTTECMNHNVDKLKTVKK